MLLVPNSIIETRLELEKEGIEKIPELDLY